MFIKTDSNFSIFISDLRKLKGRDKEIKTLSERRQIINCTNKNLEPSNVLKMIYFAINSQSFDTMQFIKAIGSDDIKTKKYGYLGLLLSEREEYLILTFNTLMKDLRNKPTRELALNFLCNVNLKNNIYSDLSGFICTKNHTDTNKVKSLVAKSRIYPMDRLNLVGSDENLVFVKVQILLENLLANNPVDIVENDTLFLTSFYGTTTNSFLKVKLLQLYKILNEQKKITLTSSFFQCIEKDIISPHEVIKPLVDISLSVEILDLLISTSNTSQKTDSFLFRLIDSQNNNSRYMGFRLAIKHKMFANQVINKAIKNGINQRDCYEALMFFINKSTYKEVYKRKDEMRFMMDKQNTPEKIAKEIMKNILLKISEYSKDDLYLKIYYENPELCLSKPIDRNLSEDLKSVYFKKLIPKNRIKYFPLLYSLLPRCYQDKEFYKELFQNHLNILISSKSIKASTILERLILTYLHFQNLGFYRDLLVSRYFNAPTDLKECMLDGIHLMNTKCCDKALLFGNNLVIKYSTTLDHLKINIKGEFISIDVKNGGERAKKVDKSLEGPCNIYEYELHTSRDVVITIKTENETFIKNLYLSYEK
ncbi:hypothetical protein NGRA_1414 [Nosema granulosis]|uniref:Uncharacterized protein n=1 Tax=Nosema granulosis TaxID=83296 RepID=A0A9P6KZL6_9MICR|nr:hypothetical protein NGRA_1414 [Nosema granulosis]